MPLGPIRVLNRNLASSEVLGAKVAQVEVQIQRTDSTDLDDDDFLALVRVSDGRQFKLGIVKSILDVWREQVGSLDVDQVAERLAKDILDQEPSTGNLDEGFLVTLDNGYATPIAAEQNLRNSGVLPFLAGHHDHSGRRPTS
jgi:hypothetical protein